MMKNEELQNLQAYIKKHAEQKSLSNTLSAMQLMQELIGKQSVSAEKYQHCLMVCRMLIDLNLLLNSLEEDLLLSSSICHIIPEEMTNADLTRLVINQYHLNPEICSVVMLLSKKEDTADEKLQAALEEIQQNKIALLIALTDRGNIVEQLYDMSSWQVRRFIYETRRYYFPVCIYAKEHYHELLSPIGILLEKLRNLTDVSEALLYRFEEREIEISQEILALQEENATIRGILKKLTSDAECV